MNYYSIILSLLSSIFIFFMAVFVLIKDWRDQINRYYVFYNVSALGILFTMFLTYSFPRAFDLTVLNRITQLSTVIFFASVFMMSLIFPKTGRKFPFRIAILILLPAFVTAVIVVFTDLSITQAYFSEGKLVREFRFFYTVYAAVAFLYLISGTVNFIRKYIREKVRLYRLQMRYVFVGVSLAIVFAAITSIIMPRFFGISDYYVIGPSIASFVVTISLFYTVITHNLMDIKTAIHKTVMYIVISMLIIIPIYAVLNINSFASFPVGPVPYYIIAIVIVIVFIIYSVYIQPVFDRIFKKRLYEFEDIVERFIRDVEAVKDLDGIISRTTEILFKSLYLKKAFFLLFNEENMRYELTCYSGEGGKGGVEPVDRTSSIIRWFIRNQDVLLLSRVYADDREFSEIRSDISAFFNENETQVIIPVYHERRLVGLFCLGEKESYSEFSPEEVERLQYFQNRSSAFISTAMTYQKAIKEQLVSRTIDLSSSILSRASALSLPNMNNIKFGAFVIPKYEKGTDYFDFLRPGNQGIGVIITDTSGVGVNNALYSVLLRSSFQSQINEAPSTYSVMQKLNRAVYKYSNGQTAPVSAYYLYYDIRSMRLMYSNAGFSPLEVFRVEKNNFDILDTEGAPLGLQANTSFGIGRTNLLRGDIGILYSRSLVESQNRKGEKFGQLRLRRIISDNRISRPAEITSILKKSYDDFMGLSSPDTDVIMIMFKIM